MIDDLIQKDDFEDITPIKYQIENILGEVEELGKLDFSKDEKIAIKKLTKLVEKIKDEAKREAGKLNKKAIEKASKKLRRLRLTDVFGEKDIPQETVKSVFQRGLGGLYEDEAIVYVLRFGIKYYLDSLKEDGGK